MEFSKEEAAEALAGIDEVQVALAATLTTAGEEYVYNLANVLNYLGAPRDFSIARIIDTVLMKTENAYGPVSREEWLKIYDDSQEIKEFLAQNTDLVQPIREQVVRHKASLDERAAAAVPDEELPPEPSVAEKAERRAFGIDLSDLDEL